MIAYYCYCYLVTQLCPALCDPMDYSPPGSSVPRILQARILEWVAICFSDSLYANLKKKKKKVQMNLFTKQEQTHREQIYGYQGKGVGDRLRVWD